MIRIETPCENIAWYVYRANCITISKDPIPGKVLSRDWCFAQIHAEHSTLEQVLLYIYDSACRGDVASHIVRHTKAHPRPVVESWRTDWTGKPRPSPETPRKFIWTANPVAVLEMMRQRLCVLASIQTLSWASRVKAALCEHPDVFVQALGECCLPDCERRGGVCHQALKKSCGRYPHWTQISGYYKT